MATKAQAKRSATKTKRKRYPVPDLTGWTAYGDSCKADRTVHRCREHDAKDQSEYFDYVCDECDSILLTIARAEGANRPKIGLSVNQD